MNYKLKLEEYIISKKNKVKISSKDIKKGDIFLALQGKNYHGNKFILSALKKGAKFCLTDKRSHIKRNEVIYVKNLYSYLTSLAVRKRDLYTGKVVGITGSAGKTTLKETLAFFLKKNFVISYSEKSYNNKLGVLISILNLNLKSNYSIFEIGTNNFGEIKNLTKIVKPAEIFITNIQSTHLEYFKSKNNIAREKADIFSEKYNKLREKLYLNKTNIYEDIILQKAKKEKKLKIIRLGSNLNKYFIKNIIHKKNFYQVVFSINKKNVLLKINLPIIFRLANLLFCYAFFSENSLKIQTITKNHHYLKPVDGRGLTHTVLINKRKIKIIDESYNANPDTMLQTIDYFYNLKKDNNKKILIIGNMNELGSNTNKMHLNLLYHIEKYNFKFVILCGEFYLRSIKKLINPKNEFIYLKNKNSIMQFLEEKIHKDDIILSKCSNSTEVNKFVKLLLTKGKLS